ncbi:hypothetical protein LEP1GSC035_3535 [Leptospira noguchii str. 2007001578]|uniref:Uncharacterized protein n=1 Tax=Leptospira noguchii str. 2007001578 TaxID=1049974 RepID=A0ABN0IZ79_9LEPT|nr:hypothetical protein LEP1GSC035_3535 [Leptospira noguchii str. 2007001578]
MTSFGYPLRERAFTQKAFQGRLVSRFQMSNLFPTDDLSIEKILIDK